MRRPTFADSYGPDFDGSMDIFKVEASPAATYWATTVSRAITAPKSPRPVKAFATARILLTSRTPPSSRCRVTDQAPFKRATPVPLPFRELQPWVPSEPMRPELDWDVPHNLHPDEDLPEPRSHTPITRLIRHVLAMSPRGLPNYDPEWNLPLYRRLEEGDLDGWSDTPFPYLVKDLMQYTTPSPSTPELEGDNPCDEHLDEDYSTLVDDLQPKTPARPVTPDPEWDDLHERHLEKEDLGCTR